MDSSHYVWGIVFVASLIAMYEYLAMGLEDETDRRVSLFPDVPVLIRQDPQASIACRHLCQDLLSGGPDRVAERGEARFGSAELAGGAPGLFSGAIAERLRPRDGRLSFRHSGLKGEKLVCGQVEIAEEIAVALRQLLDLSRPVLPDEEADLRREGIPGRSRRILLRSHGLERRPRFAQGECGRLLVARGVFGLLPRCPERPGIREGADLVVQSSVELGQFFAIAGDAPDLGADPADLLIQFSQSSPLCVPPGLRPDELDLRLRAGAGERTDSEAAVRGDPASVVVGRRRICRKEADRLENPGCDL